MVFYPISVCLQGMDDLLADEPMLSEKEQDRRDRQEMMDTMSPDDKVMHEPIKLIREGTDKHEGLNLVPRSNKRRT